jgi:hypothetical protein
MRAVAVIIVSLAFAGCGVSAGDPLQIPADQFCAALVDATCDRELRCGRSTDPAQCRAAATAAFDGCPLDVQAIALQETDYNASSAHLLVSHVRGRDCDPQSPDPIGEIHVFSGRLGYGEVCHSDASCTASMTCNDLTVANPQGVCGA